MGLWFALLLLFAGAFLRCPPILIHGRVWAEESSVFLIHSWNVPFFTVLLAPQFGYFSIWDNFFAAVAVHGVPLTMVALLFTWSAVLLLLVTGYFIYQAEFLVTRAAKTAGVLALLLTPPCIEPWLNLINSEFYFGIFAAVILLSNASRLRIPRNLGLAVAVLSGPLTTLLAPFFVLRSLVRRRRDEMVQAVVVCVGALLQVGTALTTTTANRIVHFNPLTIGPVLFNKQFVFLFLNRLVAKVIYLVLLNRFHFSTATLLATWFAVIVGVGGLLYLLRRQRTAQLLLLTALWLALLESSLALDGGLNHVGPGGGERYAFTPNVLIELAIVAAAFAITATWRRTTARVLLALAFFSGAVDYLLLPLRTKSAYQGEPWRQQVLRWERDPATPLKPSPTGWPAFHLPSKK
ncbi:hypothetical protein AciPR4_0316 [Terriglobus saanensis SP1PR4]|uniref:Glycosyltransferase RgtA/B/C/D-like domain-containing protein n=2 Tax=Terriglobus saanensis TaxID=870903 RepID=E8V1F8_TERSS|nr:hypothetical protein AciPR4_0316 [Terriglobus saanensis SP1PR4]